MKDVKVAKQVEQRNQNQQNHYGPSQQQDRQYIRNDNNKLSNATYGHDSYQDKCSRNDRGRSPSRVCACHACGGRSVSNRLHVCDDWIVVPLCMLTLSGTCTAGAPGV
jgi:hypothetical protein